MSANLIRPTTERATIAGPVGSLEALLEIPAGADGSRVAVICHPHPVYGGTMTNKVVHMLAKACNERGVPALRFNFRGVGASAGRYDEGEGETQDALAAIDWALQRWPGAALWAAGFSFGGAIAVRAAVARDAQRLVTVAPAVHRFAVSGAELPRCPWLLVQGDRDELVDAGEIERWVATLASPPQLALLPGVDHFFHGRLNDLRAVVLEWLDATEAGS
jgi:alpha/beta superfamily hydrolase